MHCANCGAKLGDDVRFCAACGQSVGAAVGGRSTATAAEIASQVRARIEKEGLIFVTAIAFYLGFWSLMLLIMGAMGVIASFGMSSVMGGLGVVGRSSQGIALNLILILTHALGAFGLAAAYGLIQRQDWGRRLAIIVSILMAGIIAIGILEQSHLSGPTLMLLLSFMALNTGSAGYLRFAGVRERFSASA